MTYLPHGISLDRHCPWYPHPPPRCTSLVPFAQPGPNPGTVCIYYSSRSRAEAFEAPAGTTKASCICPAPRGMALGPSAGALSPSPPRSIDLGGRGTSTPRGLGSWLETNREGDKRGLRPGFEQKENLGAGWGQVIESEGGDRGSGRTEKWVGRGDGSEAPRRWREVRLV